MNPKTPKQISEILVRAGYPGDFVVLDFETYFDDEYSLETTNTWKYVLDPRFEIMGLGLQACVDGELWQTRFFWPPKIPFLIQRMKDEGAFDDNKTIVMQNARFDQMILEQHFGIRPKYVVDIKHLHSQIRPMKSNKLKDMALEYGLQPKGHTVQFKGYRPHEMDVAMKQTLTEYAANDIDLETKLFMLMLPQFTCPEIELPLAQHTTNVYLTPVFEFDFALAKSLLKDMQKIIDNAIEVTGLTKKQLGSNKEIIDIINEALPEGETCPMKPGKKGMIPALAKDDDGLKYLLVHPDKQVRDIVTGRQAVKSWPKEVNRVERMVDLAESCGGKLPVPMAYSRAHTGRWQGEDKINLYNLGGKGRAGKANHPLLGKVRQLLKAPEGCTLLVGDSAQIEARVLAWLAGQNDLVEDFANNADPYSKFATGLFGLYVRKSRKDDPPQLATSYDLKRGFGKDAVLGAGYGMGTDKFHSRCLENDVLRPLFDSGQYTKAFIKTLIDYYRTTYSKVPWFWNEIEKMFRWVVKYPHEVVRYAIPGSPLGEGHDLLTLWNDKGTVTIQLPSGRCLVYQHSRIRRCDNALLYGKNTHLWGGTLTENVVQSIARDLLGYWILECENADLQVLLHIYDEIVSFSLDSEAANRLECMMSIMRTVPAWAAGLPVDAEGKLMKAYEK